MTARPGTRAQADEAEQLLVFAKAPRAGLAKTRLAADPGVGAQRAARLARAFLADTLALGRQLAPRTLELHYAPRDAEAELAELAQGYTLRPQAEGDLGGRVAAGFEQAFARGAQRVVVLGSDTPQLEPRRLLEAYAALEARELVLGPSHDGGYYLIGLARPAPRLFEAMPWSTPYLAEATLRRAAELGLSSAVLSPERDIDDARDLAWLVRALERRPATTAVHTRHALAARSEH